MSKSVMAVVYHCRHLDTDSLIAGIRAVLSWGARLPLHPLEATRVDRFTQHDSLLSSTEAKSACLLPLRAGLYTECIVMSVLCSSCDMVLGATSMAVARDTFFKAPTSSL